MYVFFSFKPDSYQLIFKSQRLCVERVVKVWKYQWHGDKIEKRQVEFNMTFRGNGKALVRDYHGLGVLISKSVQGTRPRTIKDTSPA